MPSQPVATARTTAKPPKTAQSRGPGREKATTSARGWPPWLRWLACAAGAVALVTIVAWLALPAIVRSQLESRLTVALDRHVTIESVAFDPFSLRLTLHELVVADRVGTVPLLTLDELVADMSAASIRHRAPVLDGLKLTRPSVSLARDREGRYSIEDLIDRALALSFGAPAPFSLNNVEIDDGSITFDDGVTGRKHVLAALDIGIPFLSSLPHETAIRVTPRVAGTLNGTRFALGGSATPFAESREATLDIDLEALQLPFYAAYLPGKPRLEIAGGELTTHLKIAFVEGKPGERSLELRGEARVDKLAIDRRDGSALGAARRIAVTIERIDVLRNDARVTSVSIDAPTVDVKRLADGTLEWAQALNGPPPRASTSPQPSVGKSWQVWIGRLAIDHGTVALGDDTSQFHSTLVDVALDASNLTTRAGEKAHVKLGFVSSDRIASFSGEADVEPSGPAATGRFALSKFSLGLLAPYYRSALAVDVQKGSFDFASAFALDAAGKLRLSGGEATISDVSLVVPGKHNRLWRIPQLAAHGVDVDVPGRTVTAEEIMGQGAALRLLREPDGMLEMARFLRTGGQGGTPTEGATWTLLTRKLGLDHVAIDFEDRVAKPPVKLAVRELALTATDITNAPGMQSNIALRAQVEKRGRLEFAGLLATHPLRVSGQLDASGLALAPLQPYLEPRVNVVIADGTLTAKGRLAADVPEEGAVRASWRGDVSVADFAALDEPTSRDLARWKTFSLDGMDIATAPFRANVDHIGLKDFYARAIVHADGTLNFVRLLKPAASAEPAPDAQTPSQPATPGEHEWQRISIGRIDFERGNVNFSDFFIQPNYSVNFTDVAGFVSTMSEEHAGDVSIVARVDGTAPAEVRGHIHPFAKELSLDIAAEARDVELPPLTPYSVKYAGYGIRKGKLTFDVRYQVENRKLTAENHLIVDQLTFGEHVDSPTATKLPVLRTVALLKDANGVIDIRLPISGSLDDPEFSVGGLFTRQIVGLLTKAATAPFTLLPKALGGGEELSTVTFAAGSAAIGPDAEKRIATLAKALSDRPALKLAIGGRADPVADREGLRHVTVEHAMKRAKMKALVTEGTTPASIDQVTIGAEERDRWLKEAYREAPLPDRPRDMWGMLKDVPPADMEAMLLASATVEDDALRSLANARAQAVRSMIVATGVASDRLFVIAPRVGAEPGATSVPATLTCVELSLG